MSWYYLTRNPLRNGNALPPVEIRAANIHTNATKDPRTGVKVYGWIEVEEELDAQVVIKHGLIYGGDGNACT